MMKSTRQGWSHRLFLLFAVLSSFIPGIARAAWFELESPDGSLKVTIDQLDLGATVNRYPQGNYLYYRVDRDGIPVLDWSPLGIRLSDRHFDSDLVLVSGISTMTLDRYSLPHGKQRDVEASAWRLTMKVENAAGLWCDIVVKAYNDGIAFRYEIPGSASEGVFVLEELSGFRLANASHAYLAEAQFPSLYTPNYEVRYDRLQPGVNSPGDGFFFPALFEMADGNTNVLLHEAGLTSFYAASRLDADASENLYRLRFPSSGEGDASNPAQPASVLPLQTPWRLAVIGDGAAVVESNLVTHLGQDLNAVFGGDASWVKPGKAAWSWWSQGTGSPALQKEYVDFAVEHGWDYVIVDEGWSAWTEAEIEELVQYAADREVGIFLWYNSGGSHNAISLAPRDRLNSLEDIQAEFEQLAAWGVAGVKVDFFQSDKQARIVQQRHILYAAAEQHLLVDFHGSTVPRGWRREFPNLLTTEAVLGAENYKWNLGPTAADNVKLAFTRNVVGAMDYTPLTFDAALQQEGISYAHQLAVGTVFESALQVFAGRADSDSTQGYRALFARFPFLADQLRDLPTAWDETRLLSGHPDSHAVIARRSGDRWYIGGINNLNATSDVLVDLSSFANGVYDAQLIVQGAAADELVSSQLQLDSTSQLPVSMLPGGGFTLELRPRREQSPWYDAPLDQSGQWRVTWMGYLNDDYYPWVSHREHGTFYAFTNDPASLVLWSEADGWWWLSETDYPLIYELETGSLLYYVLDSANPRWFYDSGVGDWVARD